MNKLAYTLLAFFAAVHVSQCNPVETSPLIVGGIPANIADFPHQLALLDMVRGGASGYICGASNIHRLWALSAAHCLQSNTPPEMIQLYGGSTSRLSGGRLFFVSRYILHPSYSRITLDNDIAVIQLNANYPLEGFPNVRPIPIPASCASACCGSCAAGNDVVVTGWGTIDNGSLPENLMQVSKAIMSNQECGSFWRVLTARMFCTIVENGRDSCNGDSGSAVVRNGVQVGVVSFGSSVCGDGSRPAVYVRLENPQIRSFIAQHVGI